MQLLAQDLNELDIQAISVPAISMLNQAASRWWFIFLLFLPPILNALAFDGLLTPMKI